MRLSNMGGKFFLICRNHVNIALRRIQEEKLFEFLGTKALYATKRISGSFAKACFAGAIVEREKEACA
jgi:hypothetical protein